MNFIYEKILTDKKINRVATHKTTDGALLCSGISYALLPTVLKLVDYRQDTNAVIVMPTEKEAKDLNKELNLYGISSCYIPPRDKIYYNVRVVDNESMIERLIGFRRIINDDVRFVITSLYTLLDNNVSLSKYKDLTVEIKKNVRYDLSALTASLTDIGYKRVSRIETKGEFSLRGSIMDIYPIDSETLVRVEFFDDEVDTVRLVDRDTRLSVEYISSVEIFPAKEIISDKSVIPAIKSEILSDCDKRGTNSEKFKRMVEELEEGVFESEREIIFDCYPKEQKQRTYDMLSDRRFIVFDVIRANSELSGKYEFEDVELKHLYESGEILRLDMIEERALSYFDIGNISERTTYLGHMYQPVEVNCEQLELNVSSTERYDRNYLKLFEDVGAYNKKGYEVVIAAGESRIEGLIEAANDLELNFSRDAASDAGLKIISERYGIGFDFKDICFVLFGDENISGALNRRAKNSARKKNGSSLRLSDLSSGDYVIHEEHGAGVYRGIKTLEIKGVKKDYLEVEYKDNDKLFVSVENINQIDKYMSKEGAKPKIYRLDSVQWKTTKAKSKKAIDEMARDLVELYAKRHNEKGYAFSKDTTWQREFEDGFKYEETDGQLLSSDQIKRDMEEPHPMDRLLLGDVGYGKTEVALRAAFKAIMDGKQVAFLTPTTLLSEQHTKTALSRFNGFPVKIRSLSRFRSKAEISNTLKELKAGNVDMLIGTHRILSSDVVFKDLGLLIVDEEQRFGVSHKEKIKKLSTGIDVLTLSATPIPRTLSMSLSGIRSLSVIDEPPQNRIPVQTYVTEYNPNLIRSAILREVNRGGQVFFIYNDVKNMDAMLAKMSELVPEVKFVTANGQMNERHLEKIFNEFESREYDVLITSTIIETGMDIPNVNTLIVADADRFGLSTLYQLRGRVGRSSRLAYAYFTYNNTKSISEKAVKRLMTMKEFTDFGSGYKIAMRDLELRGAGNILGLKQHGHMSEIGYELYMKYLSLAVKVLQGETVEEELNSKIDLEVESALPYDYLSDELIRMEIYRRIAALESFDDMDTWIDELVDKYNEVPKPLENLMYIGILKNMASKYGIKSIIQNKEWLRIEYIPRMLDSMVINDIIELYGNDIIFDSRQPIIRLKLNDTPIKGLISFFKVAFRLTEDR